MDVATKMSPGATRKSRMFQGFFPRKGAGCSDSTPHRMRVHLHTSTWRARSASCRCLLDSRTQGWKAGDATKIGGGAAGQ
eukprot:scaffold236000_cov20-Tisochrysis_lutea.AAC.1